ncbi:MAG: cell wall metabolism sensor histidine kinase WalK [Candidatus Obscuribacterales bacterium]|nr:cell wall metabolism sensor histidine kinase WalK [Candidatus Obscuribacterales bacterium]
MATRARLSILRLQIWQKVLILVAIPLGFEILFISVLSFLLFQVEQEARVIEQSRNLVLETENLQRLFFEAGTAIAGFNSSQNPLFAAELGEVKSKILIQLGLLADLAGQDESRKALVKKISNLVQVELKEMQQMYDRIDRDDAMVHVPYAKLQADALAFSNLLDELVQSERTILKDAPVSEGRLRMLVDQWLAMGVAMNVLIAVGLVHYFNASTTRRLTVLMDNTKRLSREEELLPPTGGYDEIAKLDTVFREMADALNEATRKERAVVDNAVDVICSVDKNYKFIAVNPACEKQWGYSRKELTGRRVEDILFFKGEQSISHFQKAIEAKENQVFELVVLNQAGRPVDSIWSVHWSESDKLLFCVVHDITDRKRAEQLRKDVIAMVSHDLRSPLTSIQVSIEIMENGVKGTLPFEASAELRKMGGSTSRMVRLINDFLDMEKLQSGKLQLKKKEINLDVLVANSIDAIRSLAESKNLKISERDTDIDLFADGDRVIQVIINLLANSIKFSPPCGEIEIAASIVDGGVRVSITDQGPGIELGKEKIIFESFEQLDDAAKVGSSGLGLSICKKLVELHGGSIGVTSLAAKGSTFWFILPNAKEE